jgi:hypothetical protein
LLCASVPKEKKRTETGNGSRRDDVETVVVFWFFNSSKKYLNN